MLDRNFQVMASQIRQRRTELPSQATHVHQTLANGPVYQYQTDILLPAVFTIHIGLLDRMIVILSLISKSRVKYVLMAVLWM